VSADDCGAIIGWIQNERDRRRARAREQSGAADAPPDGIDEETMEKLMREFMPHLYEK